MFGTTREFLDYFGLKKLEDLPPLSEIKDGMPELSPQTDLIQSLEAEVRLLEAGAEDDGGHTATRPAPLAEFDDADSSAEHGSVIPLRAVQRSDAVE
jgi:segregation and condensation protein B